MNARRTLCAEAGCDRTVVARRLCRMHYLRAWRAGESTSLPGREREVIVCPKDHGHTADTCWTQHGCRCARCVHSRNMERQRRRNRLRAYGREDQIRGESVDAGPVREHVASLLALSGVGLERIADAAGLSRSALLDLRFGRRGTSRPSGPVTHLRADIAGALLAVSPDDVDRSVVPALGTVRRLQALVWMGHTQTSLAQRMGWSVMNLSRLVLGKQERVSAKTRDIVVTIFDELWQTYGEGSHSEAARRSAAKHRWQSPLARDDIDGDPEPGVVAGTEQTKGERILEDVEWLLDSGESVEQITASLRRTAGSISKLAERHGRVDIARPFWNLDKGAA